MTPIAPQHIPTQMVAEIAFGIERGVDIAFRYGYHPEDYELLAEQEFFQRMVAIKVAELKTSGWTTKKMFATMAEDLMQQCYKYATQSDNTALKLEVAKYAAKLADMEPKQNAPQLQGTGFSININLSGEPERTSVSPRARPRGTVIDIPPSDLPAAPAYLSMLPFESLSPA